jgi:hypothetical protein
MTQRRRHGIKNNEIVRKTQATILEVVSAESPARKTMKLEMSSSKLPSTNKKRTSPQNA